MYRFGLLPVRKLDVPCIAVGNVVVGGTGKTPAVLWLIAALAEMGARPAVVSRGYGGTYRGICRVPSGGGAEEADLYGDEPALLAGRYPSVPVIVGRDRYAAGLTAVREHGADVVVADDAFQHRRLARDIDLLAVDARRGFGNGRLLPRGPLRERISSLGRAQIVLLNRVAGSGQSEGRKNEIRDLVPEALMVEGEVEIGGWRRFGGGEEALPGKDVFAFCGLANPAVFRRSLEKRALQTAGWRSFPDHHRYDDRELQEIADGAASAGAAAVLTTEKDAVRIGRWPGRVPLYAAVADLEITSGERELRKTLEKIMGTSHREGGG